MYIGTNSGSILHQMCQVFERVLTGNTILVKISSTVTVLMNIGKVIVDIQVYLPQPTMPKGFVSQSSRYLPSNSFVLTVPPYSNF